MSNKINTSDNLNSEPTSAPYFQNGKNKNVKLYLDLPEGVRINHCTIFHKDEQETSVNQYKTDSIWEYYTSDLSKIYSFGKKIVKGQIPKENLKAITVNNEGRIIAVSFRYKRLIEN